MSKPYYEARELHVTIIKNYDEQGKLEDISIISKEELPNGGDLHSCISGKAAELILDVVEKLDELYKEHYEAFYDEGA